MHTFPYFFYIVNCFFYVIIIIHKFSLQPAKEKFCISAYALYVNLPIVYNEFWNVDC